MSIWENVAASLQFQVEYALEQIRAMPEFVAMDSEIERAFAAHFLLGSKLHGGIPLLIGLPKEAAPGFFLAPQVAIGNYRVDFIFSKMAHFDRPMKWIAIECDGHDFHDRTKEQAARDKARDRYLSAHVGRVLRFTGSEIYRDVGRCWSDVSHVLSAVEGAD